ncbi:MAG TPA: ferritin-like domain-containing protein [Bdellovibrionota bacterium]|jgi:ferritin-like metal-binding protein YciE|nr:ferritin-like domain-containing protein [Bdellovibrionota bacterium]
MSLESIQDLLVDEVKDLYSAELQLMVALPKMAKAASNAQLRSGIETHLRETQRQVSRLEQVFELMDVPAKAKHCKAMEGLIKEGSEVIEEKKADPAVKDAALIAAAQKVEHYEIASYGSAIAHANLLGLGNVSKVLEQTLVEEKSTDQKLTSLAEGRVNLDAAGASSSQQSSKRHSVEGGPSPMY